MEEEKGRKLDAKVCGFGNLEGSVHVQWENKEEEVLGREWGKRKLVCFYFSIRKT